MCICFKGTTLAWKTINGSGQVSGFSTTFSQLPSRSQWDLYGPQHSILYNVVMIPSLSPTLVQHQMPVLLSTCYNFHIGREGSKLLDREITSRRVHTVQWQAS